MRTHTGNNIFHLSFDCKIEPQQQKLRPYNYFILLIILGERPYGCDVCMKRFAQRSTLNIHKKTHTGQLQFQFLKMFSLIHIIIL